MRVIHWVVVAVLAAGAVPVWAQNGPDGERGPRMRQFGQRGDFNRRFDGFFERMTSELNLDETQRAEVDRVAAPYRERMRQRVDKMRQMREAYESGDTELADQLRTEIREQGGPQDGMPQFIEEIRPLLRPDQVDRLDQMQTRMRERFAQGQQLRRAVEEIPDRLNLDEDQRAQFDEQVQSGREAMRSRWEEMRRLSDEAQAAVEAGEMEKAADLRTQIEAARSSAEPSMDDLFKAVEGILREDQKPALAEFRKELAEMGTMDGPPGGEARGRDSANVRNLFRAVRRLQLSDEQEKKIKELEQETMRRTRELRARDADERQELFDQAKREVVQVLEPDQAKELESALSRGRRQRQPM